MEFEHSVRSLRSEVGFFTGLADIFICRAPGRLDLMGGNDDYTGGLVFETTIGEATYAAAQLSGDQRIMLRNKTAEDAGWKGEIQITLDELRDLENLRRIVNASNDLRWTAYVLGNLHWLLQKYPGRIASGIRLYMESNLPLNRGVSSSAAIEVAVMKASAAAYGIDLCGVELALACQWVENVIAGSACGIMDQVTVVLGQEGFMLPLVCQPCLPEPLVRLPDKLQVFGIDSGVSHQVAGVEYEAARAAAFMGYKIICDHENIAVSLEESAEIGRAHV